MNDPESNHRSDDGADADWFGRALGLACLLAGFLWAVVENVWLKLKAKLWN